MAILTINDNPSITDTIIFSITTPDAAGCFLADPYEVNTVTIYYVQRDFANGNTSLYENKTYETSSIQIAEEAEALACASPTPENIENAKKLRAEAESNSSTSAVYFNEASPVNIVGNDQYPAWLSTDPENAFLEHITLDANNNTVYGQFTYTWQPKGMREGDYFICWTWTPIIAGTTLTAHTKFSLIGDTQITTSIPTHFTDPKKYPTLLDRYLPEMYKMVLKSGDRTPDVLEKLNKSISSGFTDLENLANQIVDLQDANSLHESLIPYLSNFFDLKLKTSDPTRWRGQIKRAIPLFKSKGTMRGLDEALEHAAIKLRKLTHLWEIISNYTWQEVFTYSGSNDFILEKVALPVDFINFEIYLRPFDSDSWIQLTLDYIVFNTVDNVTTMTWVGNTLSIDAIDLVNGDELRVIYLYNAIPSPMDQSLEFYLRSLPLMDQRDERDQIFPLKNWNTRVIAENDMLLDLLIPNRHPYCDFITYGKIRTEFPYSENIYNMDEYNGSIRNSKVPCDIDRDFISPCTACFGSSYNIDLEIENLSDDRIIEAQEVLNEFVPFHAVLHTLNFIGSRNDYIESPLEDIEYFVDYSGEEFVLAGEAQIYFTRYMKLYKTEGLLRNQLANYSLAVPTTTGTAYNDNVVMFCPTTRFDNLGMILDGTAELHILSPSPLTGVYYVNTPNGNVVNIAGVLEPIANCNNIFAMNGTLNSCAFAFDLNNPILSGTLCNIAQDNVIILQDVSQYFLASGVQSQFDVDHGTAISAWTVYIPAYDATPYTILNVTPENGLLLEDHGGTLPSSNVTGVSYQVKNGATTVFSSSMGHFHVQKRGRVTALSLAVQPVQNVLKLTNYYHFINNEEYPIIGFVDNTSDQYYIGNYQDNMGNNRGDINNANLTVKEKLIKQQLGYFSSRGLKLQMSGNYESSLGIQNGVNNLVVADEGVENDGFKENFIVIIDSDSYFISEIDGNSPVGNTTFTISGNHHYWKTLLAGGTSVNVTIYKYVKEGATIRGQLDDLPEHTFRTLDRSGRPIITGTFQDGTVQSYAQPQDQALDIVNHNENISFKIEYTDGTMEQGEIST